MNPLAQQRCQPLEGQAAMSPPVVAEHLRATTGWAQRGDAIERSFHFDNYHQTLAFVNALAWVAHSEDHHPELRVTYNCCTVRFNTHSVGGISINDFICAAKLDALLPGVP